MNKSIHVSLNFQLYYRTTALLHNYHTLTMLYLAILLPWCEAMVECIFFLIQEKSMWLSFSSSSLKPETHDDMSQNSCNHELRGRYFLLSYSHYNAITPRCISYKYSKRRTEPARAGPAPASIKSSYKWNYYLRSIICVCISVWSIKHSNKRATFSIDSTMNTFLNMTFFRFLYLLLLCGDD